MEGGVNLPIARKTKSYRPLLETLEDRTVPTLFTWTGAGNDNLWDDAANWDQNSLPTINDDVFIGQQSGNIIIDQGAANNISTGCDLTVNTGLTIGASLTMNGTLHVPGIVTMLPGASANATLDLSGQLYLSTGSYFFFMGGSDTTGAQALITGPGFADMDNANTSLTILGSVSINNFLGGGALQGPGTITVTNQFFFGGGSITGQGTFIVNEGAQLNLSGSDIHLWTINNYGTANLPSDSWQTCTINNFVNPDNTPAVINPGGWTELDPGNPSTINNAGLISVVGIGGNIDMPANVNSTGTIHIGTDSSMTLTGIANIGGTVTLDTADPSSAPGDLHVLNGNVTLADQLIITGPGFFQLDAGRLDSYDDFQPNTGTVTLAGTVTADNVEVDGGTLQGPGTLIVNDAINWTGGLLTGGGTLTANGTFNINPATTVEMQEFTIDNYGAANWEQNEIDSENSEFNNYDTFNIDNVTVYHTLSEGDSSSINNYGLVVSDGGTVFVATDGGAGNPTAIEAVYNNEGETDVDSGETDLEGGGESDSDMEADQNALLCFAGNTFTAEDGASFQGAGQMQIGRGWDRINTTFLVQGNVNDTVDFRMRDGGDLTGPGTFSIYGVFTWSGGTMTGVGSTLIGGSGTMIVDFADIPSGTGFILMRRLDNGGTMTINSGQDDHGFNVAAGVSFMNDGQLNLTSASGGNLIVTCQGSFKNIAMTTVSGGNVRLDGPNEDVPVQNFGSIEVVAGSLSIQDFFANVGGNIVASGGAAVNFLDGTFTFSGGAMQGAGTFNMADPMAQLVAASDTTASNFYMSNGTLSGNGDFSAQYFAWSGGTMSGNGKATTTVAAGARMDISDSVFLNGRILRDQGLVTWVYAEAAAAIAMGQAARINVDGGQFQTYNVAGEISLADESACAIRVSNGGVFARNMTEVPGTITIGVYFVNNGGTANIQGDTDFSATYRQVGAASVSEFGGGNYEIWAPNKQIFNGGTVQLQGGTLNGFVGFTNTSFTGNGTIESIDTNNSKITLNGDLSAELWCSFYNQTNTYLGGFQLSAPTITNNAGCTIFLQNGTLNGAVTNNGTIN
jgi:hypothetical protein